MGEDKAGAARIGRIDPDAAAEDHGDLTADGQSQSGTLLLVAVEFLEAVEDHLLLVERNAGTGVGHREEHLVLFGTDLHPEYDAAFGGELGRIGQQVDKYLRQAVDGR